MACGLAAFPALLLNYAGQSAIILSRCGHFTEYLLPSLPAPFLQIPLVILAATARLSCQSGHLLPGVSADDPTGDSAWLVSALAYPTNHRGEARANLYRRDAGNADDRCRRSRECIQIVIREPRRIAYGIAIVVDDADDLRAAVRICGKSGSCRICSASTLVAISFADRQQFSDCQSGPKSEGGYIPLMLSSRGFAAL